MTTAGFGLSDFTRGLVRARMDTAKIYQVIIARGSLGTLDPATGLVGGLANAQTIYQGAARVYSSAGGRSVDLGGGEVVQQDTTVSIPWDAPVPATDDLVAVQTVTGMVDPGLASMIFRVLNVSGGGMFGESRRLGCTSWQQSRYWGEQ